MPRQITSSVNEPLESIPTFEPIFGKVVIRIEQVSERKYGSLVLPQRERGMASMGKVHAVYAAEQTADGLIEPQVKVGDTVIFGQFTGTAVSVGRETFVICKEHDLLTIIRPVGELPEIEEVV